MLSVEDKKYIHNEIKQAVSESESRLNERVDQVERQFGVQIEKMHDMFQHFAEMIMSHIDKKFETLQNHELRIVKLEKTQSMLKGDVSILQQKVIKARN